MRCPPCFFQVVGPSGRLARPLIRAAAAIALAGFASLAAAIAPGETAPDVQLDAAHGPAHLSALRGKLVYLDFWASWCGPCRQSFPWMNGLQTRFGAQGLQVVAVNVDARAEDARRFLAEVPAQFTVAYDPKGQAPRQYAIKGMPTSVLIGPDGKVLLVHSGFRAEDRTDIEQAIAQSLPRR
ncbi:TlpA disulfide reductase family protein [Ideonella sp.]|uniref:TlpA family protein disulfide reductase n=1 Tax=Ideonella sp. TaxID=1929293 RepID=UPI002B4A1758|nr:TlpA disulfide reductase family protein [Ideonella sp.]HJV71995.1 TlpA disulfide reductase family protein [Ideonella sp.]